MKRSVCWNTDKMRKGVEGVDERGAIRSNDYGRVSLAKVVSTCSVAGVDQSCSGWAKRLMFSPRWFLPYSSAGARC